MLIKFGELSGHYDYYVVGVCRIDDCGNKIEHIFTCKDIDFRYSDNDFTVSGHPTRAEHYYPTMDTSIPWENDYERH
jgi:hypothetical protein